MAVSGGTLEITVRAQVAEKLSHSLQIQEFVWRKKDYVCSV